MALPTASARWGAAPGSLLRDPASPLGLPTRAPSWSLPEWCAVAQVAGPAILYLPGTQIFRVPLRFSVFGISLLGLLLALRRARVATVHPAWKVLVLTAVYLGLMIFHPTTNSLMAGLAQIGMFLAVASPLFWGPDYFLGDFGRLWRILAILWALNGASAVVGILQVRDPNTWLPAEFSRVDAGTGTRLASLRYRTSDNRMVLRPPGLGDAPGAACGAGMFVASMGLVGLGLPIANWKKLIGLAMGMAGVSVIFLSMVRSSFVVLVGCSIIYLVLMIRQRRWGTALLLAGAIAIGGLGSLQYASSLGGQSVVDRFASLVEHDPMTVYKQSARMDMVTDSLSTLLIDYPLGAGLGRWGMMRAYFGDPGNLDSPGMWAEVQFAAWVLDGGIVLLSAYMLAIFIAVRRLWRICLSHGSPQFRQWGAVIITLSAAPIALIFSWTPFNAQSGMQFWLLIGAFEGACQSRPGFARSRGAPASHGSPG